MKPRCCKDCLFSEEKMVIRIPTYGEPEYYWICRRFPPLPLEKDPLCAPPPPLGIFPRVGEAGWCGEWRQQPPTVRITINEKDVLR